MRWQLFRREPSKVNKQERMKFIALKTCDGGAKGRISFCCKALKVTRQGFHECLKIVINPRNTKNWRQKWYKVTLNKAQRNKIRRVSSPAWACRFCFIQCDLGYSARTNVTIHTAGSECIRRFSLKISGFRNTKRSHSIPRDDSHRNNAQTHEGPVYG